MSSHAVLSSHLTTLMKDVSEALKFDRQDKNEVIFFYLTIPTGTRVNSKQKKKT